MPIAIPVTAAGMSKFRFEFSTPQLGSVSNNRLDYASVVFAGFTVISAAWYFIRGRKSFTGPPIDSDIEPVVAGEVVGNEVYLEKTPE